MQQFVGRVLSAFAFFVALILSSSANAASISIASPGGSPAGYLPLDLFGTPAIAGVGDDTIHNLTTQPFLWAGQSWTSIGVVSNGYLVIGGGTNADVSFVPSSFPNPAAPNNVLAPFWADLNPSAGGAVRATVLTDGVRDWIVVDWAQVPVFGQPTKIQSFEIWLGLNGFEEIYYVYGTMNTAGVDFRIGAEAEDVTGTVGANYLGAIVSNETDLRVTSEGIVAPPQVPLPGALPLFATGLSALALLGWRRKRKAAAAAV